MLMKVVH